MDIQKRIEAATAERVDFEKRYIQAQNVLKSIENAIHAKNGAIEELNKMLEEGKALDLKTKRT
mgnify:CR=1 FL=1